MSGKVSPDQFKLFMTGTEWMGSTTHSTDGPRDTVWQDKTNQANAQGKHHGAGLTQSIHQRGYQHDPTNPPTIILEKSPNGKSVRKVQSEGHHRVAAAAEVERTTGKASFIPTNYVDTTKRR